MVELAGGTFRMGSSREEIEKCMKRWASRMLDPSYTPQRFRSWLEKEHPDHEVRLSPFAMGKFPVTNGEYRLFVKETGARTPPSIAEGGAADHPVWGVRPEEAEGFADFVAQIDGRAYRLPREAEWEYAARGPGHREYPFGDEFDARCCNTFESGIGTTTPVDAHPCGVSELGIWDLAGNVEEWVADEYEPYPGAQVVQDDLVITLGCRYRVLRGGSFARGGDLCRSARRHGPFPAPEFRYTGFRLAVSL